jgi:hypothetical protein
MRFAPARAEAFERAQEPDRRVASHDARHPLPLEAMGARLHRAARSHLTQSLPHLAQCLGEIPLIAWAISRNRIILVAATPRCRPFQLATHELS